jgi:ABC-type glutathione transport system ATPase component
MTAPLLEVRDLTVRLGSATVLEGVSFEIAAGESVALVGESGAGKSTLARALLRLLAPTRGEVRFDGQDLTRLEGAALRALRPTLQLIFQHPAASLDPRMTVGATLAEPLALVAPRLGAPARRARIEALLARVGLGADTVDRRPRELSGGECQRVAFARALATAPRLLVCDEPVSALDVSIQGQIVNLLAEVNAREGMALLVISHNLAVVRYLCRRIVVLLAGRVLEVADTESLFAAPAHPYTRALLAAVPTLEPRTGEAAADVLAAASAGRAADSAASRSQAAEGRAGTGLDPTAAPGPGCVYAARCAHAIASCLQRVPALEAVSAGQRVACHRWRELRRSTVSGP